MEKYFYYILEIIQYKKIKIKKKPKYPKYILNKKNNIEKKRKLTN